MSKKVLIIIAAVVFLMMGMMGAGFYLIWQKMSASVAMVQNQSEGGLSEEGGKTPGVPAIGPIFKLETMIVNLADQGGKRYLRVTMELELDSVEVQPEIEQRLPQLRDTILMILPAKQYADISTTEGKIALRDEIIAKTNALLQTGKIVTIYFTEFVVQ